MSPKNALNTTALPVAAVLLLCRPVKSVGLLCVCSQLQTLFACLVHALYDKHSRDLVSDVLHELSTALAACASRTPLGVMLTLVGGFLGWEPESPCWLDVAVPVGCCSSGLRLRRPQVSLAYSCVIGHRSSQSVVVIITRCCTPGYSCA